MDNWTVEAFYPFHKKHTQERTKKSRQFTALHTWARFVQGKDMAINAVAPRLFLLLLDDSSKKPFVHTPTAMVGSDTYVWAWNTILD